MEREIIPRYTPTEKVLLETLNPDQLLIEGLGKLVIRDPVESG